MTQPTESGYGRLEENDQMQAAQIELLTSGVEELRGVVAGLKKQADDMQGRQKDMAGVLSRNTEITEDLFVIAEGFKGLSRGLSWIGRKTSPFFVWLAKLAGAIAGGVAIWQAFKAWFK